MCSHTAAVACQAKCYGGRITTENFFSLAVHAIEKLKSHPTIPRSVFKELRSVVFSGEAGALAGYA
jgi:hypothetical protein